MQCKETGYIDDVEAPEMTDAELDAEYLDQIEQSAPGNNWDELQLCICEEDKMCELHRAEREFGTLGRLPQGYARIGNGLFVRTRRIA